MKRISKQNYSSKPKITRVHSRKKQAKTTVGLTISHNLLAEARNRNLSRISEQALESTLKYISQHKETESSKFLTVGSFLKETTRAGSSVWYERLIRNQEAAGSNPAQSTEFSSGKNIKFQIGFVVDIVQNVEVLLIDSKFRQTLILFA